MWNKQSGEISITAEKNKTMYMHIYLLLLVIVLIKHYFEFCNVLIKYSLALHLKDSQLDSLMSDVIELHILLQSCSHFTLEDV